LQSSLQSKFTVALNHIGAENNHIRLGYVLTLMAVCYKALDENRLMEDTLEKLRSLRIPDGNIFSEKDNILDRVIGMAGFLYNPASWKALIENGKVHKKFRVDTYDLAKALREME
jgi:hypothetical protein